MEPKAQKKALRELEKQIKVIEATLRHLQDQRQKLLKINALTPKYKVGDLVMAGKTKVKIVDVAADVNEVSYLIALGPEFDMDYPGDDFCMEKDILGYAK